jgi:hypothetical protein
MSSLARVALRDGTVLVTEEDGGGKVLHRGLFLILSPHKKSQSSNHQLQPSAAIICCELQLQPQAATIGATISC